MTLSLYWVNQDYNLKLCNIDKNVMDISGKKSKRPFVGVLFTIGDMYYLAPLSSPKPKHLKMKNMIDFLKIDDGKLGIINLNNMIPVDLKYVTKVNTNKMQNITSDERKYIKLLKEQLSWINHTENKNKIIQKSMKLRNAYLENKLPANIRSRCVNFQLLEEKLLQLSK